MIFYKGTKVAHICCDYYKSDDMLVDLRSDIPSKCMI